VVARLVECVAAEGGGVVLVHGASAETDKLSMALGHPPETIVSPSGHQSRRTDRRTLEIFAMAALGVENFAYVELLQRTGLDAVGLSGLSGRTLVAERKNVRAVRDGRTVLLRDDYTGTIKSVNTEFLEGLISAGKLPVIAPLAISLDGEALNVDGDRAAANVAVALGARELLILTNVPGLLRDVNDPGSLIDEISVTEAEMVAQGRMKKKVLAAREALEGGVPFVAIRSAAPDISGTQVVLA
jgi:acetylglutamate/LysW-gamma-L-alpha-aminoadipate kinase